MVNLPQWTQLVQTTIIVFSFTALTHTQSFIYVLHYLSGTTQLSLSSIKFPLSQPIPKDQNNKREDKK